MRRWYVPTLWPIERLDNCSPMYLELWVTRVRTEYALADGKHHGTLWHCCGGMIDPCSPTLDDAFRIMADFCYAWNALLLACELTDLLPRDGLEKIAEALFHQGDYRLSQFIVANFTHVGEHQDGEAPRKKIPLPYQPHPITGAIALDFCTGERGRGFTDSYA